MKAQRPASKLVTASADTAARQAPSAPRAMFSLDRVRVHADARAAALAEATSARAVTIGSDIYFGAGQYNPDQARGRELIAHEMVHVAQAQQHGTSSTNPDGAELEARQLARTVSVGPHPASMPQVQHAAAPAMFDRMPDPDYSQDQTKITDHLLRTYPYLRRLSNKDKILEQFFNFIRYDRRFRQLGETLATLPPITYGATAAIEKRARERKPWEDERDAAAKLRGKVATEIDINPLEILAPSFYSSSEHGAFFNAGARAVAAELASRRCWLRLAYGGIDSFRYGITGYIGGGAWLPISADGIEPMFFRRESLVSQTMLEIDVAFTNATAAAMKEADAKFIDTAPEIAMARLDAFVEENRAKRRVETEPTDEEKEVQALQEQRHAYGQNIQGAAVAATLPFVLFLSMFAVEGPVDLLLAITPVHKIKGAAKLRGALGKGSKQLEKIGVELLEHIDDEAKLLLKTASKLKRGQVKALKAIYDKTKNRDLIIKLMDRQIKGTADVTWIAKKLESGKLKPDSIVAFTDQASHLPWNVLEDIIEKRKIASKSRDSFASKMVGFLGEEGVARFVKTPSFVKSVFKKRKGASIKEMRRGIDYGGNKSVDLLLQSDMGELAVGEVKHWSTTTWLDASKRSETIAQLARHNAGLGTTASVMGRRASDVTDKVLFVSADGYKGLDKTTMAAFEKEALDLGWKVELVPNSAIDTFDEFIDKVR
ncbi:MAG: DUF4157 domain-containing protein [Kofleriaceae bacterium]